jgi:hypothetical protein
VFVGLELEYETNTLLDQKVGVIQRRLGAIPVIHCDQLNVLTGRDAMHAVIHIARKLGIRRLSGET